MDMQMGGVEASGEWTFQIGQCISHRDQPMPSLVLGRQRCGTREVYGVRSFANVDPNRDWVILGECLVTGEYETAICKDCLLYRTSMCPSRVDAMPLDAAA